MGIYESSDRSIPPDTETYYETVASQEEIYLEETEEELRMILESDDRTAPQGEHPKQEREHAAEKLITEEFR